MKFVWLFIFFVLIGIKVSFSSTINSYQFSLEGIDCIRNGQTEQFFYSVRPEDTELHLTVNFDTNLINSLLINGINFLQGETIFFDISHEKEFGVTFLFVDGSQISYTLIFTVLPIVYIQTNGQEISKENKIPCTFTLIDPYARTNGEEVYFFHYAAIRVRGGTSSEYPKKSYSVEIRDQFEDEVDVSFLGLREDGDWILDAMYIDRSRMRNRLCMDIWNSFNEVPHIQEEPKAINGTNGEFVEVFLNGVYNGLYCMSDRVDRKQLKVKKDYNNGGVIFKARQWTDATRMNGYNADADMEALYWCGWESKYPEVVGYTKFGLLAEFIDLVVGTTNPYLIGFEENIEKYVYFDNLVDYMLFLSVVYADDNNMKNSFLSIYHLKRDRRFFITPWDLDATFGRAWDGRLINKYAFKHDQFKQNSLTKCLLIHNPLNFYTKLKERWEELKEHELSIEVISQRINNYRDLHLLSNASQREKQLWGDTYEDITKEAERMKSWYKENYRIIDEYLTTLVSVKDEYLVEQERLLAGICVKDKELIIESERKLLVEVIDSYGRLVISHTHELPLSSIELKGCNGLFIVILKDSSLLLATKKILVH